KQQAGSDDEAHGRGLGIVDAFDTAGRLRVAQFGHLNAPWGLAQAPAGFGRFSGDLLIGNFGDGRISACLLKASTRGDHLAGDARWAPFHAKGQLGWSGIGLARR
ncbi:hypothetical protein OM076_37520, partial [Solirubrobacter ginsenosidimutans]